MSYKFVQLMTKHPVYSERNNHRSASFLKKYEPPCTEHHRVHFFVLVLCPVSVLCKENFVRNPSIF